MSGELETIVAFTVGVPILGTLIWSAVIYCLKLSIKRKLRNSKLGVA